MGIQASTPPLIILNGDSEIEDAVPGIGQRSSARRSFQGHDPARSPTVLEGTQLVRQTQRPACKQDPRLAQHGTGAARGLELATSSLGCKRSSPSSNPRTRTPSAPLRHRSPWPGSGRSSAPNGIRDSLVSVQAPRPGGTRLLRSGLRVPPGALVPVGHVRRGRAGDPAPDQGVGTAAVDRGIAEGIFAQGSHATGPVCPGRGGRVRTRRRSGIARHRHAPTERERHGGQAWLRPISSGAALAHRGRSNGITKHTRNESSRLSVESTGVHSRRCTDGCAAWSPGSD